MVTPCPTKTEKLEERIFRILYPYSKPKPNDLVDKILKAYEEAGNELVERFNHYLDELIVNLHTVPPFDDIHRRSLKERIATLEDVKMNFNRRIK